MDAGTLESKSDHDKAAYLKHFRVDSIGMDNEYQDDLIVLLTIFLVKDCEAIRKILLGHKATPEERKWSVMGQSFGGFCAVTYLSFHSDGLKEVFITAGLPPMLRSPDQIFETLVGKTFHLIYCEHSLISGFAPRKDNLPERFVL